jgi:integrase
MDQTGIEIREGKSGGSIRIKFHFRGVECRETLKLKPTKANLIYAERLRGEILNAIERGAFKYQDFFPESPKAAVFGYTVSKKTVGELMAAYLSVADRTLEHSTARGYRKVYAAHLCKLDEIRIRDLSPQALREWLLTLDCSAKRIRNILTPLRHVTQQAVVDGLIDIDPFNYIVLRKIVHKDKFKSDYAPDPFSGEEIESILNACPPAERRLFTTAFYTGMRTGELIALDASDVLMGKGLISVNKAIAEGVAKDQPKTLAGVRQVTILSPVRAILADRPVSGKLFRRADGSPWPDDKQVRLAWTRVLKRAGVKIRNPYQTRHTFASMMLSRGEDPMWVSHNMGHKDLQTTLRIYARWIPQPKGYQPKNDWSIKTV